MYFVFCGFGWGEQVKVAKDLSPPAREDFNSLLMVSAATGRVRFPKLLDQNPNRLFATVRARLGRRVVGWWCKKM